MKMIALIMMKHSRSSNRLGTIISKLTKNLERSSIYI